VFRSSE
jgi:hypothetical protein